MNELTPCPFCGADEFNTIQIGESTTIQCINCGAHGPLWDFSKEHATASWNNRYKQRTITPARTNAKRESQRAYYLANREARLEYQREYVKRNKERIRERERIRKRAMRANAASG